MTNSAPMHHESALGSEAVADTTEQTRVVVTTFLQRLGQQDAEGIAALCADDADWHIPGAEHLAPWLGRRCGRAEFSDVYRQLFAAIEPLRVEIEHVFVDGQHAVVTGEFASRMLQTGQVFESMFSIHLTVHDGMIVKYRLLEESYGLVEALTP